LTTDFTDVTDIFIMKAITLLAMVQARPGKEKELRDALLGLVAATRKEAGCLNYDLHVSPQDPSKFLFYETWASQAAIDAHMKSAHVQALLPRVDELCMAFPEIRSWERIA
jgi:quinol monooxygenase YgiN